VKRNVSLPNAHPNHFIDWPLLKKPCSEQIWWLNTLVLLTLMVELLLAILELSFRFLIANYSKSPTREEERERLRRQRLRQDLRLAQTSQPIAYKFGYALAVLALLGVSLVCDFVVLALISIPLPHWILVTIVGTPLLLFTTQLYAWFPTLYCQWRFEVSEVCREAVWAGATRALQLLPWWIGVAKVVCIVLWIVIFQPYAGD
jgi:hypothetical protein